MDYQVCILSLSLYPLLNQYLDILCSDRWLDRDGPITRAAEAIPGVGFIVALIHRRNNNPVRNLNLRER